jgi:DNA-binding CsgD family transcriptional regulator
MPLSNRARDSLLQQIGLVLMHLSRATGASEVIQSAEELLDGLPTRWHTVDLYEGTERRKRLASRRCPKGFDGFISRFAFAKRPDGLYQGKFADVLLVMVKVTNPEMIHQFAVAALGYERRSTLSDPSSAGCIGGLMQETLARYFSFGAMSLRADMLAACAELAGGSIAVFDQDGVMLESYPEDFPRTIRERVSERLRLRTLPVRRARADPPVLPTVTADDGDGLCEGRQKWIVPDRGSDNCYLISLARRRATPNASVPARLRQYGLSRREFQVAELVFMGKTNQVIAAQLFISEDTVKTHCRHIFGKLGIARRTQILQLLESTGA